MIQLYDSRGYPVMVYDHRGGIVFGASGSTDGDVQAGTDPATLTSDLMHVTTNAAKSPFKKAADAKLGTTSTQSITYMAPATGLRVWIGGGLDSPMPGVKASLGVRGALYELTVGGQRVFDLPVSVNGGALTDPLPAEIVAEAGDDGLFVLYAPPGLEVMTSKLRLPGAGLRAGDHALTASTMPGAAAATAPIAVLGRTVPTHKALFIDGDSMTGPPWARTPATDLGMAWTDHGQFGAMIAGFDPLKGDELDTPPWTHFLWEYGTNNSGRSQPGTYNTAIEYMYRLSDAGMKGAQTTLAPRSTSTDSWATVANQTPSTAPEWREAWNAWVRDGTPLDVTTHTYVEPGTTGANIRRAGDDGHCLAFPPCDVASAVEVTDPANPALHVWAAGKLTSDGTHYTDAGSLLVEDYTRAWMREHFT